MKSRPVRTTSHARGREMIGEVVEKKRAREIYDGAVIHERHRHRY